MFVSVFIFFPNKKNVGLKKLRTTGCQFVATVAGRSVRSIKRRRVACISISSHISSI